MAEHIYAVVEFEVELGEGFEGPDISDVQSRGVAMSRVLQAITANAERGCDFTRLDVEFENQEESDGNE